MMRKNISILVSLLILSLTACSDKAQYFEESGSVFHTSYHIKYKAKQILTDKIDSELQRFNLSSWFLGDFFRLIEYFGKPFVYLHILVIIDFRDRGVGVKGFKERLKRCS